MPPTFIPLAAAGLGIDELPAHGLEPILITADLPGEICLQPCVVACRTNAAVR